MRNKSKLILSIKSLNDLANLTYLLEKSEVRVDFTGIRNIFDFPLISNIITKIIENSLVQILSKTNVHLVLRLKIFYHLIHTVKYVLMLHGNFIQRQEFKQNQLNQAQIRSTYRNESIHFILCDDDLLKDDFMGSCSLKILYAVDNKCNDFKLKLDDGMKGQLSVKTFWFPVVYGLGKMPFRNDDLPKGFVNITLGTFRHVGKSDLKFEKPIEAIKCVIRYDYKDSCEDSVIRIINYTNKQTPIHLFVLK